MPEFPTSTNTRLRRVLRVASAGVLAMGTLVTLNGVANAADDTVNSTAHASSAPPVTYAKDIFPLFEQKCDECHHANTAAPMSLNSYEAARPWARAIKAQVASRTMPPWHLNKDVGIQHFLNDRSLTDDQIALIVRWVDGGAPEGNPKDMQAAKQWPSGLDWETKKILGRDPDFVVRSDDFTMPAHSQDVWYKPVTVLPVKQERWVRAVEIRPTTLAGKKIFHHVRADLIVQSAVNQRGGADAALMEWAIGKQNDIYREGTGKVLEPGAAIRWEEHIHADGVQTTAHVELGVWLYPVGVVPEHKVVLHGFQSMPDGQLRIAPNSIYETSNTTILKSAGRLENFQPHMHLRGQAMLMEAILPNGKTRVLSYVDHFNFNWMNNYIYADDSAPVLPKGTLIRVTAWYNNTKSNPNNPDPDVWVGYGDRTVDEMGHAWVNVTDISDAEYNAWAATHHDNDLPALSARR